MKFTVTNNALVPANTAAIEWMNKLEIGEPIQLAALTDSEVKFRSMVFLTFSKMAVAAGMSGDELRAKVQIETGRFQWVKVHNVDKPVWSVKSMNVMTMNHEELQEIWKDAKKIFREMLPRLKKLKPEAREEIETLLIS